MGVAGGLAGFLVLRAVVPRQKDVDELALEVDRLSRIVRRDRMQRVRAAASDVAAPGEPLPGDLDQGLPKPTAAAPLSLKDQLRRRYLGGSS